MKPQRLDPESLQRMDRAFYGALAVINKHKPAGAALHVIPAEFHIMPKVIILNDAWTARIEEPTDKHFPLIEGDDYGS